MHTLLLYVLKMTVCAALFHAYYFFFLRNERFHYYNRFYLLAGCILSLLIPLPELNWFTVESDSTSTIAWMNILHQAKNTTPTEPAASVSWQSITLYISLSVSAILLITLIYRIIKIFRLKHQNNYVRLDDFDLINTEAREAPFSFMRNLFWRNDIDLDDAAGKQIMQHEITHIRQKHTWDKLFVETLLCVCWFNPFFWLMRKELWMIHEFIADQESVKDRDASAFAAMLLQSQFGKSIFAPAQSFSYSPVKRRLLMLTISKQAKYSYTRKMMILPVFGAIVLLFACKLQQKERLVKDEVARTNDTLQPAAKDTLNIRPSLEDLVAKTVTKSQADTHKTAQIQNSAKEKAAQQQKLAIKTSIDKTLATTNNREIHEAKTIPGQNMLSQQKGAIIWGFSDSDTAKVSAVTIKSAQQPLFIIDGYEKGSADVAQLDPANIESLTVLKDESARSLYGSKGDNGIIIIKTKKLSNKGEAPLHIPQTSNRVLDVKTSATN
ncbi:M56 family metallopeptidase [Danxiaibacter flavus]|uniref:M56 family metallopeptidase n=1 Tax=Danxiaibacter flavus TaxID=3049108 RepID=A0ABV3ZFS1_9BACT|nr:M56 family metallopeptidase [Chitinophagaceae bacterium DXS]